MIKIIVKLGSNKVENYDSCPPQLSHIQNALLMSIVDNHKNFEGKYDRSKVRTSSVNSSSTIFSWSIHAMYDRLNRDNKQHLMFKSYITGMNSLIVPKRHYYIFSSENIVNEFNNWI